jgi:hypothetical protein
MGRWLNENWFKIFIAVSALMFSLSSVAQSYISHKEHGISLARGVGFCIEFAFEHTSKQEELDDWMNRCLGHIRGYSLGPDEND